MTQDLTVEQCDKLLTYARECSIVLMRFSGGGSEMFKKIGDEFYADPELCFKRAQEKQEILDRLKNRPALATSTDVMKLRGALEPLRVAIEKLLADYGEDRPDHQGQPLVLTMRDVKRIREVLSSLPQGEEG